MEGGWFRIPGVHAGQRTLAEQLQGLAPALAEVAGRTVADLGCAEGLIAIECAKAGAAQVWACDFNAAMIELAQVEALAAGQAERLRLECADLGVLIAAGAAAHERYDVVLALAVVHKLEQPRHGVEYAADLARDLVVFRLPASSDGVTIYGKQSHRPCDLRQSMTQKGYVLERVERGPRKERLQYWRRRKG